jgi:membrane protease YdiL (CAAX protease family)
MPAFAAILFVYVAVRLFWWTGAQRWSLFDAAWVDEGLLKIVLWVAPLLTYALLTRPPLGSAWTRLGLDGSAMRGLGLGLLATLPMAVVVALSPMTWQLDSVIATAMLGPFAEEVLFRGFLFMSLVRLAKWRPWPAIVFSATAFALAHSQYLAGVFLVEVANTLSGSGLNWIGSSYALKALAPLFAAGVLLGWLVHRHGTLWPALGLHVGINLWWELSDSPLEMARGPWASTAPLPVAQAMTIALAIAMTWLATWRRAQQVPQVQQVRLV